MEVGDIFDHCEIPRVSIITPILNARNAIGPLLESLRRQRYPRDRFEIIFVDNGSNDGSWEIISLMPDIKAMRETARRSSGAARNAGIRAAGGEILAFIDADCRAHPDWLANGARCMKEANADRVAGRVDFILSKRPNIYEIFDSRRNFIQTDYVGAGWSGTGNLFVRRGVFDEVGQFDAALRSHMDQEWGLRATRAGKSLAFEPRAIVSHPARRTLRSLAKKWFRTEFGAGQVYRRAGLLELQLWYKKANYRPLTGIWRIFPEEMRRSRTFRLEIDILANIMRYAGNIGNFFGYMFPGDDSDASSPPSSTSNGTR